MREARDFIIKGQPTPSIGATTTIGFGGFNHQQRKILGMNKPHMLGKQNELI